jgi:hypothetical protein
MIRVGVHKETEGPEKTTRGANGSQLKFIEGTQAMFGNRPDAPPF